MVSAFQVCQHWHFKQWQPSGSTTMVKRQHQESQLLPLPLSYRQRSKRGLRIFNVHNCHWREKSLISILPTSWEANWVLFTLFFIILMSGLCLKYIYLLSVITFWRDLPTGRLRIFSWLPAPSIFILVSFNWTPSRGNLKPCPALLLKEGTEKKIWKKAGHLDFVFFLKKI